MPDELHIYYQVTDEASSRIIIKPTEPEPAGESGVQCGFDVAAILIPKPPPVHPETPPRD